MHVVCIDTTASHYLARDAMLRLNGYITKQTGTHSPTEFWRRTKAESFRLIFRQQQYRKRIFLSEKTSWTLRMRNRFAVFLFCFVELQILSITPT